MDDRSFAWERPFSKADIKRFGDQTPRWLACAPTDLANQYFSR